MIVFYVSGLRNMPIDIIKKRLRALRYRQRQLEANPNAFREKERQASLKHYHKKRNNLTPRDLRKVKHERTKYQRKYRERAHNVPNATMPLNPPLRVSTTNVATTPSEPMFTMPTNAFPNPPRRLSRKGLSKIGDSHVVAKGLEKPQITPRTVAALQREKRKREQIKTSLIQENKALRRNIWRLQKRWERRYQVWFQYLNI
jgi:hypothetical protein